MNSHTNSLKITGAGLATAAAVLAATSVVPLHRDLAVAPASSVSSPVTLLAQSQSSNLSALIGTITKFLDSHQALVLDVTAKIPHISLGPVTIGGSLLADAYYSGYGGSATGGPGVLAYLAGQLGIGSSSNLIESIVLSLTAQIPSFSVGPVKLGGSVLADAYFNGYGGSATGVPGLLAYIESQLHLPALGAGALPAASVAGAGVAAVTPSDLIKTIILALTAKIPPFSVGPVKLGGSVLANAYFDGYGGSAVGLPGIIAYVESQLHKPLGAAGAPALASSSTRLALPAAASLPKAAAAVTVTVSAPKSVVTAPKPAAAKPAAAARAAAATSGASGAPKAAASTRHGR